MKLFLFSLLIVFSISINAQIEDGYYYENSDYLNFVGDTIEINIVSNGGLIIQLKAKGTYEIFRDYLLVHAGNYPYNKSSYKIKNDDNDTIEIKVLDISNDSIKIYA